MKKRPVYRLMNLFQTFSLSCIFAVLAEHENMVPRVFVSEFSQVGDH
jgi:hypothetical protein